jgi:signal transduction histidine kinase
MGLSTALSIVKGHHGIILVKSETGIGSTFQVYLPAQEAAAEKRG